MLIYIHYLNKGLKVRQNIKLSAVHWLKVRHNADLITIVNISSRKGAEMHAKNLLILRSMCDRF